MKLLYFGLPLGALLLHADGFEIEQAIMGRSEGIGLRRLRRLLGARVSIAAQHGSLSSAVRAHDVDLVVSWFFPKKLPPDVLGLGRLGTLGVHPSLLPRHRGPDPYFAAIDAGDERTGVTAHRLEAEYDTGRTLAAESLPIDPSWSAWTLARKLDRPSLRVLRRMVAAIANGTVSEQEQDEALATQAPEPGDDELELDVRTMSPERALRRIRAAAPWPGAYFFLGDEPIVVERARVAENAPALEPGELAADVGGALLGFGGGALILERVRIDDDTALEGDDWTRWLRTRLSAPT